MEAESGENQTILSSSQVAYNEGDFAIGGAGFKPAIDQVDVSGR